MKEQANNHTGAVNVSTLDKGIITGADSPFKLHQQKKRRRSRIIESSKKKGRARKRGKIMESSWTSEEIQK